MNSQNTGSRFQTARPAAVTLKVPEAFLRREIRAGNIPGFTSGASSRPRFYVDVEKCRVMLEARISAATNQAANVCAAQ